MEMNCQCTKVTYAAVHFHCLQYVFTLLFFILISTSYGSLEPVILGFLFDLAFNQVETKLTIFDGCILYPLDG